jgi:hypothetical protein
MGLFQKLRIQVFIHSYAHQMPRAINSAINLDSREQLLLRAHQSSASTGYDWVNVSCLTAGFILIIKLGKDDVLPRDGYGWMDEEASKGVFLVNGRQIEVFERKLGFSGIITRVLIR